MSAMNSQAAAVRRAAHRRPCIRRTPAKRATYTLPGDSDLDQSLKPQSLRPSYSGEPGARHRRVQALVTEPHPRYLHAPLTAAKPALVDWRARIPGFFGPTIEVSASVSSPLGLLARPCFARGRVRRVPRRGCFRAPSVRAHRRALSLMEPVAAWKWQHHQPVTDCGSRGAGSRFHRRSGSAFWIRSRRGAPFVRGADPLGAFGRRARRRRWDSHGLDRESRSRSRRRAAAGARPHRQRATD